MQIRDETHVDVKFTVRSPKLSIDEPQPGNITITNPENAPKVEYDNGWIGAIIEAITLAVELIKSLKEDSCIDKAIRGCGEGNVATYDEGGWFSGCSFTCK